MSQDWGISGPGLVEVTHRMKFGFGEAGEGNFLPQICPRPRSSFFLRGGSSSGARWTVILMTATLSRRACTIYRAVLGCQRT